VGLLVQRGAAWSVALELEAWVAPQEQVLPGVVPQAPGAPHAKVVASWAERPGLVRVPVRAGALPVVRDCTTAAVP
jgi:hypothetical protein